MTSLRITFRLCQTCGFFIAEQYENNSFCTFLGYYMAYSGNFVTGVLGRVGTIFKGQKFLTLKECS